MIVGNKKIFIDVVDPNGNKTQVVAKANQIGLKNMSTGKIETNDNYISSIEFFLPNGNHLSCLEDGRCQDVITEIIYTEI